MNFFEIFLYMLQGKMKSPISYGWFHFVWIFLTILSIILLYKFKDKKNEKTLKLVLGTYGIVAFVLELLKQLIWAFNYDVVSNLVTWDYTWYSFPFQLCTTPIYVSIICLFLKDGKLRKSLLSFMAFVTILGGFMTILIPDSCFTNEILINIHTMWLHCGSFVVSVFLLMFGYVKVEKKRLKEALIVFLFFVFFALTLNIIIYNSGILGDETFNMFYISPYFISSLPVFNVIQENVTYLLFLLIYIFALSLGATIVYCLSLFIKKIYDRRNYGKEN